MSIFKCSNCKEIFEFDTENSSKLQCSFCSAELDVINDVFRQERMVKGFTQQKGYPLFVVLSVLAFISVVLLDFDPFRRAMADAGVPEMVVWIFLGVSLLLLSIVGIYMKRNSKDKYECKEIFLTKKKTR